MVILNIESGAIVGRLLVAEAAPSSLPPATRAAALMALVVVGLIGILIVAAILVGGHWVRRQGDLPRGPTVPPDRAPLASPSTRAHTAESENDPPPGAGDTLNDAEKVHDDTRPD